MRLSPLLLSSLVAAAHSFTASAARHPRISSGRVSSSAAAAPPEEACDLDEPSALCGYDPEAIDARFADEPLEVARRLADISLAVVKVKFADDDGATLRAELSRLGPGTAPQLAVHAARQLTSDA